ncbi:hypothetical protein [Amycolatopsis sp. 195334CR]|uniref:hypothetical protein n=1 Tax=Amycolatopsis sp. 195334CR TaxID=2814588 RepID=UPI001A8C8D71|nr:hypothetical protein [Amycolatopsis sp. 195334CR]MBN6041225.1 hypothetical protein [Amycolatopsis sp. 195334CR]
MRKISGMTAGLLILASGLFGTGIAQAEAADAKQTRELIAAGYVLVEQVPLFEMRINLWKLEDSGQYHGQITSSSQGDYVYLQGGGCPGGATCHHSWVQPGQNSASTLPVNGAVDACGRYNHGGINTMSCTCVICFMDKPGTNGTKDEARSTRRQGAAA